MARRFLRAIQIAGLDDHIAQLCLRLPPYVRIRRFGVPLLSGEDTSINHTSFNMCRKARQAMEQLRQLGCECNKVDMVNGVFGIRSHSSGYERVPSAPVPPSVQPTHSGSSSHLHSTLDGLDCLSRTFVVLNFEMLTIAGLS
jgi:hypothetical protein